MSSTDADPPAEREPEPETQRGGAAAAESAPASAADDASSAARDDPGDAPAPQRRRRRDRRSGRDRRARERGAPDRRRGDRRRPGCLRRFVLRPIVWLLLLVVVLAVGVLWYLYRPSVQQELLARFLPRVEEYLGRDVTVGRLRYSLFPLWIELRDVSVGGPNPGDPPILTVRRVYLLAELRSIRRQRLRLSEVQAEGVVVFLDRFLDGTDNWPRPRRRGTESKKPWELDIRAFTVNDALFRYHDDAVPMDLDARNIQAALLGMGGTDVQGRVVTESVTVALPHAHPYTAAVDGKVAVHREGLEILVAHATSQDARVSGHGKVRWRGDKRVDLQIAGDVSSDLFRRLGYIEDQVDGRFRVDGTVEWKPGVWGFRGQAKAPRLRALDWELAGVEASIAGDRNAVWADIDRAQYGGGNVTGWVEVLQPNRGANNRDRRRTRLQLRLEGIDAERFLDDADIQVGDLASRVAGTVDYHFDETDWRHGQGVADLRLSGDSSAGHGLAIAGGLPLVVDRGVVTTAAVRLSGPGQEITGAARYELPTDRGAIDYHVQSSDLGGVAEALPISPAPDGGAPLWLPTIGRGELSGTLELAPKHARTELHLALEDAVARGISADRATGVVVITGTAVEDMRLELAKGTGAAVIAGNVLFAKGAPWNMDLDVAGWPVEDAQPWLEFDLPVTGPFTGSVTLAGAGTSSRGTIVGEVAPAVPFGLPADRVRTRMAWDDQSLRVEQLALSAPAGEAVLEGTMAFPGHQLDMTFAASALDLAQPPFRDRLGGLAGSVSLAGTIGGTLEKPSVRGDVLGQGLRLAGKTLGEDGRAALHVDWSGTQLATSGSLLGLAQIEGGGALDVDHADITFKVRVDELGPLMGFAPAGWPETTGTAEGTLRIAGPLTGPELTLRLDRLAATVGGTPLVAREPVRLRLVTGGPTPRLLFDSLYLGTPEGGSELVVAGSVGLAAGAPIDLRMQGVVENAWLTPILPGFRLSGATDVLGTVRGTLDDPRINGQAALRPGVTLTSDALSEPITDVRAVALFYADRMVIDSFTGNMGGGALTASGAMSWPRGPGSLSARFQVGVRKVTLHYPEGWQVRGDGDLVWAIAGDQQTLRGQLELDRAYYLRNVDIGMVPLLQRFFRKQRQEVEVADEGLGAVQLNLQVRAPDTVRIKNNLADIKGSAELTFRGSLARPILFGRVEADPGGSIVYNDTTYRIERGSLTFANPYRVEPLLDLVATTRVASYDVRMSLFGNLERLNATFSSDPPLPELEVLSLLVSGSPGRLEDELSQLTSPQATGTDNSAAERLLVGQAASLITHRVGSLFGFDAFRIEPLSRSGESVSSARVTVGKRISRSLYLTYSYDPEATGGQRVQVEWNVGHGLTVLLTQEQDSYAVDMLMEHRF